MKAKETDGMLCILNTGNVPKHREPAETEWDGDNANVIDANVTPM